MTLGSVPSTTWDTLRGLGIDLVYLLGLWRRSAISRDIARTEKSLFSAYDVALPGWRAADIVGSAFSISAYEPDPAVGTWDDLDAVRRALNQRGMGLIVDFVPNHTGFDHAWLTAHPDRYVTAPGAVFRTRPSDFRAIDDAAGQSRYVACGRDPNFAAWTDVAQLNYFNNGTRAAMVETLRTVAQHADGARCDMAMLVLNDVFARTWASLVDTPPPRTEFWSEARAAVPGFTLIAEVYWDREWQLQQLGFDFAYDKRLYDRLRRGDGPGVRAHLTADLTFQNRLARFIENHDEERSATAFGVRDRSAAVAISTLPGLRFYHDGQFEGRRVRVPMQLGAALPEPTNAQTLAFYKQLLSIANRDTFHRGEWRLLDVAPAGDDSHENIVAWRWTLGGEYVVVVVNVGARPAQGHVRVLDELPPGGDAMVFEDLLDGVTYPWSRAALESAGGLYVQRGAGESHVLRVSVGA